MTKTEFADYNIVSRLKDLFNAETDSELATLLGRSRQSLSLARKENRLSRGLISVAAEKLGISESELRWRLNDQKEQSISRILLNQLLAHFNRLSAENHILRRKIETLTRENASLRADQNPAPPATDVGDDLLDEAVETTLALLAEIRKCLESKDGFLRMLAMFNELDTATKTLLGEIVKYIQAEIVVASVTPADHGLRNF